MNKTLLSIIVVAVVVGAGAFYGGMKYAENSRQNFVRQSFGGQNMQNLSPEERQQRFQQMGAAGIGFRAEMGPNGSDFTSGEIISKDAQTLTIKLRDNSSKIIFYSNSTEVSKFVSGEAADLEPGKTISVSGTANSDGTLTARTIQLRLQMPQQQQP
jgi:hypothetical protein